MNELQNVEGFKAKIYGTAENPLFLAKDIAEMIEIKNNRDMLNNIDDDEKLMSLVSTSGQNRNMWFLTEDGLYEVLMQSRKQQAKLFKKKVKEILKTIRKHGAYMTSEVIEKTLTSPDFIIKLATQLKTEQEKTAMLSQQVAESRPKADYYDRILKSKSLVTISQIADDYGMTAQALNKMLYELQIQHKVGGQWLLYAKHKNHGYTFSDTTSLPNYKKGGEKVVMNTKWTQKGRIFIYNVLKSEGILPTIEKNDAA
ncbi:MULTISPECIES: phage antirepressor KilAC domain-containing protein [unclassified Lactococcus]|uniref:phage antirepressor n=1 Tax=unclassified Lactococcus TaxID=2643510 RepID=UPI0011CBFF5C|nr:MULTISPECIES: phage antirepressor KilAC domain-containing protein [unclassified Lactococcus]MQW23732.1 phage antirepressor protein [Lactococcus sp. dk101]TXK37473.1 phage antirepressor protein [Lactococcus sp. dk310]TXK48816.1 phage antirepressor protein [Lactococcus sp. dk322]